MLKEQFVNNGTTTLTAGAISTDTTLSVATGSVFPATGNFRIIIDSEIMLVTARSTNTLTVVRGQEGTTAASHSSGAQVAQILTVGSLKALGRDNDPGFDGSRPPFRIMDASGNTLTSSSFTQVNLSTSTITDADGTIVLKKAGNAAVGENVTALARSAPATPNALIVGLRLCYPVSATSAVPCGVVGFRESSTGKLFVIALNNDPTAGGVTLSVYKFTNPTTLSATAVTRKAFVQVGDVAWFKVTDDGTNLKFFISHDGVNWIQVYSEARTTFMAGGPDQFIFGANNYGNDYDTFTTLVHWSE